MAELIASVCAAVISAVSLIAVIALSVKLSRTGRAADTKRLDEIDRSLAAIAKELSAGEARIDRRITDMGAQTEGRLEAVKGKLDTELRYMRDKNDESLEKIRAVVDEKLTSTLESKLSESYKTVTEQLEAVHKGLGEVNSLAGSVNDIKKVFANVKLRGTWGEVQLGSLLSQMLAPAQYEASVKLNPLKSELVDFAVKIPSKDGGFTYLPIDSKFPVEQYTRLIEADSKDRESEAVKELVRAVKKQADSIADKYIAPPYSTDFAVMYLPLEGLYAEVMKNAELEGYLRTRRIIVCGPTNLSALLSTLQTGFKTVAIERRSGELWQLLSAFKNEFEKFTQIFEKTRKKLQEAQDIVESAGKRTVTITRKLKGVADIGDDAAQSLLSDGENID